jgi:DNA-binding XRE family transcriptional regulator
MERDWVALGASLAAERRRMHVTQADMAARIGITRGPLQAIERGDSTRVTSSIRSYAREVGWTEASVEDILNGGQPTVANSALDSPEPVPGNTNVGDVPYTQALPPRIAVELQDGTILDTDVIDLSAPGSSGRLVLVAMSGTSDATPEQQRAEVLAWARLQRKIRKIVDEELSDP